MPSFLRTRAFLIAVTALGVFLAIESFVAHDTVRGVLFLVMAGALGLRVALWNRLPTKGEPPSK